ncbi:MAG: 30S ribosomal protein S16 [Candidatus Omnitrophota bacterium]|nr:MAG: 30S ribosomal protein S16 [Candidatus Omnitrophota bacterium]RKY44018.1 MAG: 30S ribosomal protein S16 [Candidatus Omnitrophota bacterium]
MLKIRLRKPGKSIKGRRHFKIVVCEARSARESKFVEEIGYYNPSQNLLKIDLSKYQEWIKKGAHPTETVASLAKKYKKEYKTE